MIKKTTPQKVQVSAFLLEIFKIKSSCEGHYVVLDVSNNDVWIKSIKKGTCDSKNCIDISNIWLDWTPKKASSFIDGNVDNFIKQVNQLWESRKASLTE